MNKISIPLAAMVATFAFLACGKAPADYSAIPRGFPIPEPPMPVDDMAISEAYSVEIDDRLFELGGEMVAGRFEAFAEVLTDDFRGHSLTSLAALDTVILAHDSRSVDFDPTTAEVVDGVGFLQGFEATFGDWTEIEFVRWDVLGAEFQPGRPTWGKAQIQMFVIGRDADDRIHSVTVIFDAQVLSDRGRWALREAVVESRVDRFRTATFFTDISAAAGVGYEGLSKEQTQVFEKELKREPFSGAACADVNGDGNWDFFVGGKGRNSLYLGKGDGTFDEVAEEWGILSPADGAGACFFDYDNDQDQDLVVVSEGWLAKDGTAKGSEMHFFRHDGDHFTDVTSELGLNLSMYSQSVIALDYDNDGWLDFLVTNYGRRARITNSWSDSDNGDINALFRNLEGKGFEDVTLEAGLTDLRWSYAAGAADFDRDGDQDICVANDYARNSFYRNLGDGTFENVGTELAAEDLGFGMGVNWGDLNNDGLLDLYIANMSTPTARRISRRLNQGASGLMTAMKLSQGNAIMLQQEDGSFKTAPVELGGIKGRWAWGCATNDFDLDGRLDIFCANGMFTRSGTGELQSWFFRNITASEVDVSTAPRIGIPAEQNNEGFRKERVSLGKAGRSWGGHERDKLWLNHGEEGFIDFSDVSGVDSAGDGRAAIAVDIDDDGDLDLLLNEFHYTALNVQLLMRNDIQEHPTGFLKIQLRAVSSQYQAVGAEVIVETPMGPCSQVLSFGTGFVSQNPPELVFGLGDADSAKVEVIWPGGIRESFGMIEADSRVKLVEGSGSKTSG